MTREEFEKNLEVIRNSADEALTSVEYLSVIDEFENLNKEINDKEDEISKLNDENNRLREINSNLQLNFGKTVVVEKNEKKDEKKDDEIEITDDDFIEEVKDLI